MKRSAIAGAFAAAFVLLAVGPAAAQDDGTTTTTATTASTTTTSTTTTTSPPTSTTTMSTTTTTARPMSSTTAVPTTTPMSPPDAPEVLSRQQALMEAPAQGAECDPNYGPSTIAGKECIPLYDLGDVDCSGTPYDGGNYPVTGSDVHGLDADGDGIACEQADGAGAVAPPTTASVAGSTASPALAQTGSTSGPLAAAAAVTIALGLALLAKSVTAGNPLYGRLRGATTYTTTDRTGTRFTYSVARRRSS